MERPPTLPERLAPWIVRLAALWVLVVSCIKMFKGSPASLPLIVRENPLGDDLTFYLSASVELAFALVALVHPRFGWWLMSALLVVFLGVLAHLISIGATSCGCFGGAVKFTPYQMLAVDGPLFVALLATRPWRSIAARPAPRLPLVAAAVVGAITPWIVIPMRLSGSGAEGPQGGGAAANQTGGNAAAGNPAQPKPWSLPAVLPPWARLRPPEWVGKSIHEVELAKWMDTRSYSDSANWVLYLDTCTHCRDFLNLAAAQYPSDPKVYVFVKLSTPEDEKERIIQQMPPGEQAALPPQIQYPVGPELPPWELVIDGGLVKEAIHHDVSPEGVHKQRRWVFDAAARAPREVID